MSHRVGALLMPAPAPPFAPQQPGEQNTAALDPALDVLGSFFRALLEHYCEPSWKSIAPKEPLVRKLSCGHDPEDLDFSDNDLPLLALWREGDGTPARLIDASTQSSSQVNVLWVSAPATEQLLAARSPFFNAFTKAMQLAYQRERDPCWVRDEDVNNVVSRTYGSYVWGLAGIDGWNYGGTRKLPVVIRTGSGSQDYPGYLATWTILESTETDVAELGSTVDGVRVGTSPTIVDIKLTDRTPTEEDPDVFVRQHARVPKT